MLVSPLGAYPRSSCVERCLPAVRHARVAPPLPAQELLAWLALAVVVGNDASHMHLMMCVHMCVYVCVLQMRP